MYSLVPRPLPNPGVAWERGYTYVAVTVNTHTNQKAFPKYSLEPRLSIPDFVLKLRDVVLQDKIWNQKPVFKAISEWVSPILSLPHSCFDKGL